jgi:hypothetical protein
VGFRESCPMSEACRTEPPRSIDMSFLIHHDIKDVDKALHSAHYLIEGAHTQRCEHQSEHMA